MLYTGGLTIQTTINQNLQITAQREFELQISHLRKELKRQVDGGLISFEVSTGQIRAIVGGYDFYKTNIKITDSLIQELDGKTEAQQSGICSSKQEQEKDLCLLILSIKTSSPGKCNDIKSEFYRFACMRA